MDGKPLIPVEELHRQAHVWLVSPESIDDRAVLERCRASLCSEELQQYRRFRFAQDQHRYLVSHALVRQVLSQYLPPAPADWRFVRNAHGRPEIAGAEDLPALRFNLTHTSGLAACLVTLDSDCGIDSEKIARRHRLGKVAGRMFSEAECKQLEALQGREFEEFFHERWTLREAYVKALGIGISFPTRKLCFEVRMETDIQVTFLEGIDDRNANWQFRLLRPTSEHIVAIALRRKGTDDKQIISRFFDLQAGK